MLFAFALRVQAVPMLSTFASTRTSGNDCYIATGPGCMYFNINESVVGTNSAQTTDTTALGGARATSSFGNLSVSAYWRQPDTTYYFIGAGGSRASASFSDNIVLLGGSGAGGLSFPNPLSCYDDCSGKYTLSTSFLFGQYSNGKILAATPTITC